MRLTEKEAQRGHASLSVFVPLTERVWGLASTYGSGSSTSFFFRSNWSFDIILKCQRKEGGEVVRKTRHTQKLYFPMSTTRLGGFLIESVWRPR